MLIESILREDKPMETVKLASNKIRYIPINPSAFPSTPALPASLSATAGSVTHKARPVDLGSFCVCQSAAAG